MTYWANEPKLKADTITTVDNLQKLGNSKPMEGGSKIVFSEARYFVGEEQDSFVFQPLGWTEVKGANRYEPELIPSLIHFTRKDHKGYKGVVKELTPRDKFFCEQLSKRMESGKSYKGSINTAVPDNVIASLEDPQNADKVEWIVSMYISLEEIAEPTALFQSLTVVESRSQGGYGGYGGGSKAEPEADKIKARQEAIKAILTRLTGKEDPKIADLTKEQWQEFVVFTSFSLGLTLPNVGKPDNGYF